MGVTIDSIEWRATYVRFGCSEDDGELYLYRRKTNYFVPLTRVVDPDGKVFFEINLVSAFGREMLEAGEWIICRPIPPADLQSLDALLEARPHLLPRLEREARRNIRRSLTKEIRQDKELTQNIIESELENNIKNFGLERISNAPFDPHDVIISDEVMSNLSAYNQIFRYGGKRFAYTAVFAGRKGSTGNIYLFMDVQFFRKFTNPRNRGTLKARIKSCIHLLYNVLSAIYWRNGKRILFFKQNGDHPTENMQALIERMNERGIFKGGSSKGAKAETNEGSEQGDDNGIKHSKYKMRIRCRNVFQKRQNPFKWFMDLCQLARADYIFVDDYTPVFNMVDLRPDQTLVQLWHAGVGFKSVGYARFGLTGSPDPYGSCHRKYTYALCGNEQLRTIYAEVFGIEETALLATGMPRLDHFLEQTRIEQTRRALLERFPWLQTGRVVVFAPTYRGTGQKSARYPYDLLDFDEIYHLCQETNTHFVFKMHGFIRKEPPIPPEMLDRIHDLSAENLNDLYYLTDVLITDYSSCFYDFLLLKKPVIFYMPDKKEYEITRGVQRPIEGFAPGLVVEDFASLLQTLRDGDYAAIEPSAMAIDRAAEEGTMLNSDRVIDTIIYKKDVPGVKLAKTTPDNMLNS